MTGATRGRVLFVDDDGAMCALVASGLARRGFVAVARERASEAIDLLRAEEFDVVVTDLTMRGMGGIELCGRARELRPDVPVVVVTAFGSLDSAVQAIRAGAYDFLTKPFELEALELALDRAIGFRSLSSEVKRLRERVEAAGSDSMLGNSPALRRLREVVARVAPTEASVLIAGETGTGKELVARELHARSSRAAGPFVAVNCSAIPETLIESELFGHVRGAFTDARADRRGLFQQAEGGTLFLDEIAELAPAVQPKLLRALQERRIRPVGSDHEAEVDARVLAATHVDLEAAVEEGRFREDLFYRINVVLIEVPPLRARGGDALLLAQHFLSRAAGRARKQVTGIEPAVARKLLAYPWPGNVRELENAIERAVALTGYERLTPGDLPPRVQGWKAAAERGDADDAHDLVPLEEVERRHILRVLESVHGNRTSAARILGLDRKTLYRKLGPAANGERNGTASARGDAQPEARHEQHRTD